jgi:acyl-CoA thioesterase
MTVDAAAIARASAEAMWGDDAASRSLGMQLISVEPGHAVLAMAITEAMVNGHDLCHGGYVFTLADSAFAFACNSYNQRTVAHHSAITFVNSARRGDRLVARAVERSRVGRSGIYDVTVTREEGLVIAEFRGHSRTIGGELVPGLKPREVRAGKAGRIGDQQ